MAIDGFQHRSLKRKYEEAVNKLLKKNNITDPDPRLLAATAFGSIGGGGECESFCDFVGPMQLDDHPKKDEIWMDLTVLAEEFKERDER